MGLNWVRLDTQWPHNPKFLILAQDKKWHAITAYMGGLAWAGSQGQDGFIPSYALPMFHATKREASELVEAALWDLTQGGWDIHDWKDYQPTTEEMERRSARARSAAHARWGTSG
jgi:hypothetical protein